MAERLAFDTVIVGGGTTGCVTANRLTANPSHRVALIEAGPDFGPAESGNWPDAIYHSAYQETPYDWDYFTDINGRHVRYTRGKVMGGSSSVNAAGINWGLKHDYAEWESFGNPGWGFEGLLPFFQKAERLENDTAPYRGSDGAVTVTRLRASSPLLDDIAASWEEDGYSRVQDVSGPEAAAGIGFGTVNARNGVRFHAAAAYLDPVRGRPNLTILDNAEVERLVWQHGRVTALEMRRNGELVTIEAGRVVLAAGSVGSPVLLQRSGIGPADRLRAILGDQVALHDLPGVGRNLNDHFGPRIFFRAADGALERLSLPEPTGKPGRNLIRLRLKSRHDLDAFDIDVTASHLNHRPQSRDDETLSFSFFLIHPKATGSLCITSPDPRVAPHIDSGIAPYEDLDALARGIEWMRERVRRPKAAPWVGDEITPGTAITGEPLRQWVLNNLALYHHPTGTCKLGPDSDPLAVVDGAGKVRGFENLSIVDSSVFPTIPRGMIILTVYAVAEKIVAGLAG